MRLLIANLKHLYQCRRLWVVYPVFAVTVFVWWLFGVFDVTESIGLGTSLLINLLIGFIVGGLTTETQTKPFAYCLPGHRTIARRMVFLMAAVVNLILSWIALNRYGLSFTQCPTRMAAVFFLGMTSNLCTVCIASSYTRMELLISVGTTATLFVLHACWAKAIEAIAIHDPAVFIVFGLAVCIMVWCYLEGGRRARVLCGMPVVGIGDSMAAVMRKGQKVRRRRYAQQLENVPPTWVADLFLKRMLGKTVAAEVRHAWGSLYLSLGPILEQWKVVLLIGLGITVGFAYGTRNVDPDAFDFSEPLMIGAVLSFMVVALPLPIRSSMLLAAGRRERFFASLAVISVITLLILVLLSLSCAGAALLHSVWPNLFGSQVARPLLLPLVLVPIFISVRLIFRRFALQYIVFLGVGVFLVTHNVVTVPSLLIGSACAWAVLVLLLCWVCAKQSLTA